jgi:tocopherol O-methyltransferase
LQATAPFDSTRVRDYYDRNTAAFVALGQGGTLGAIHRAVWAPGVGTRESAFRYVEDQLAELIRTLPALGVVPHVVDLGCGVGGSLAYLAAALTIRGTGITLSPVQASLAARRLDEVGLSDRVACVAGDYCSVPPEVPTADLAFAIESFVHAADPRRFFDECRALVRPGGLLVICDDFKRAAAGAAAAAAIEQFCNGWHVNTLIRSDELRALAASRGFEHERTLDLSEYLEIHRTRDRLIGVLLWLGWRLPGARTRLQPLSGGHALQTCLARGWIGYDLAIFRRF